MATKIKLAFVDERFKRFTSVLKRNILLLRIWSASHVCVTLLYSALVSWYILFAFRYLYCFFVNFSSSLTYTVLVFLFIGLVIPIQTRYDVYSERV